MIRSYLYIAQTERKGRGIFTNKPIRPGTIIEISPVLVMSAKDRKAIDKTLLHDYIFEWGDSRTQCCVALGWVSLYNHAFSSNCEYEMDFEEQTMLIRAVKSIKKGEELSINYNGEWNNTNPLWFEVEEDIEARNIAALKKSSPSAKKAASKEGMAKKPLLKEGMAKKSSSKEGSAKTAGKKVSSKQKPAGKR